MGPLALPWRWEGQTQVGWALVGGSATRGRDREQETTLLEESDPKEEEEEEDRLQGYRPWKNEQIRNG